MSFSRSFFIRSQAVAYAGFIAFLFLTGCSTNDPARQISKMLKREVVLPEVSMIQYPLDPILGSIHLTEEEMDASSYLSARYKIVMYLDPKGCTSCSLDFRKVGEMVSYCEETFPETALLLYIHSDDESGIKRKMQIERFHYPSFKVWQESPWSQYFSFDVFCLVEYIKDQGWTFAAKIAFFYRKSNFWEKLVVIGNRFKQFLKIVLNL